MEKLGTKVSLDERFTFFDTPRISFKIRDRSSDENRNRRSFAFLLNISRSIDPGGRKRKFFTRYFAFITRVKRVETRRNVTRFRHAF